MKRSKIITLTQLDLFDRAFDQIIEVRRTYLKKGGYRERMVRSEHRRGARERNTLHKE